MNEQKNNGRGIFYGVIGVATLVVAIIGATFAYFTASAANNVMTGNMATVSLGLHVEKQTTVDVSLGGMVPMSNSMVEPAVNITESGNPVCVDDNGNAVCQVYKITLTNSSSAAQFVDGYVALRGGSGEPTDIAMIGDTNGDNTCQKTAVGEPGDDGYIAAEPNCEEALTTYEAGAKQGATLEAETKYPFSGTTMRWAQVFVKEDWAATENDTNGNGICDTAETTCVKSDKDKVKYYSTAGDQFLFNETDSKMTLTTLDVDQAADPLGFNRDNMFASYDDVIGTQTISGNSYPVINKNYIRISNHDWKSAKNPELKESYDRKEDITSALVFNHNISGTSGVNTATSVDYYFVLWLSETGTNQTAGKSPSDGVTNPGAENFFAGNVTFTSAQGSEVSATFTGYAKVQSENA